MINWQFLYLFMHVANYGLLKIFSAQMIEFVAKCNGRIKHTTLTKVYKLINLDWKYDLVYKTDRLKVFFFVRLFCFFFFLSLMDKKRVKRVLGNEEMLKVDKNNFIIRSGQVWVE